MKVRSLACVGSMFMPSWRKVAGFSFKLGLRCRRIVIRGVRAPLWRTVDCQALRRRHGGRRLDYDAER